MALDELWLRRLHILGLLSPAMANSKFQHTLHTFKKNCCLCAECMPPLEILHSYGAGGLESRISPNSLINLRGFLSAGASCRSNRLGNFLADAQAHDFWSDVRSRDRRTCWTSRARGVNGGGNIIGRIVSSKSRLVDSEIGVADRYADVVPSTDHRAAVGKLIFQQRVGRIQISPKFLKSSINRELNILSNVKSTALARSETLLKGVSKLRVLISRR